MVLCFRPHVIIDNTPPEFSPQPLNFTSVNEWLSAIKMERYITNFACANITEMDQVKGLTLQNLESIGVNLLGHQKKIMNSVQTLRAQLPGPPVHIPQMQGFLV